MSRSISIELPLPPPALSPNARVHWRMKATAVNRYRKEAHYRTQNAVLAARCYQTWPRAVWSATFTYHVQRHRDTDNLVASLKAGLDGVVDAGLVPGDDSRYLTMAAPPVIQVRKDVPEGVTLRFEEVSE